MAMGLSLSLPFVGFTVRDLRKRGCSEASSLPKTSEHEGNDLMLSVRAEFQTLSVHMHGPVR